MSVSQTLTPPSSQINVPGLLYEAHGFPMGVSNLCVYSDYIVCEYVNVCNIRYTFNIILVYNIYI
jgi:hypothetical protein